MGWKPVKCLIPQHLRVLNKNQQWLSEKTGMSKQQISNYVTMDRIMTIQTAKRIAEIFNCCIDDLYEWVYEGDRASEK